jgi:hopene-associated glycosyltransferase HpnB
VTGLGWVCVLVAVVWLYLVVAHGGYWLTSQRLPTRRRTSAGVRTSAGERSGGAAGAAGAAASWPRVAAIVPARNEADMLPVTLPTLLAQDYPGVLEVIVVDDRSEDGTGAVAASLGDVRVVAGKPQPEGERWAGKVWAMTQGLAAAPGDAEYLLFTDADIAWEPGALADLVAAARDDERDMVSQMALLRAQTRWERLLVPAFVYFFAQLYPFRRVNRRRGRTAAAAGGCMLIRRRVLERAGGLAKISGALIDDVALGQLIKRAGGSTWLGLTTEVRSVRPYEGLASLWQMVARSAYTQLRYRPLLLAGTIIGLLLFYVLPPAGLIAGLAGGSALAALAGGAGWLLMSVSFLPMLALYRLSPLRALTLPLIAVLYAAMTVDSARRHYAGRGGEWKGRIAGI